MNACKVFSVGILSYPVPIAYSGTQAITNQEDDTMTDHDDTNEPTPADALSALAALLDKMRAERTHITIGLLRGAFDTALANGCTDATAVEFHKMFHPVLNETLDVGLDEAADTLHICVYTPYVGLRGENVSVEDLPRMAEALAETVANEIIKANPEIHPPSKEIN
jgi:hypothetical protein